MATKIATNHLDIPRRSALGRLTLGAGAALLSPFLRTLHADAQGIARTRFLLVYSGNGLFADRFMPVELRPGGDKFGPSNSSINYSIDTARGIVNTTEWSRLSPAMAPLAKYQKKMLVVDGLANRQTLETGTVPSHGALSSGFTCVPL